MGKRVLFDILGIVLVIIAPWWLVLVYGIIGAVLFSWYLEILLFGVLFDVIYGTIGGGIHLKHTLIFMIPLVIAELVKPRLNW